jgi:DNA-binding CsgD family transcriptional regulator
MVGSMTFVGRTNEFHVLRSLVAQVADGRGGVAWIGGEAGVGKSALLREVLAPTVSTPFQVFSAVASEHSAIFPLHVLLDALRVRSPVIAAGASGVDPVAASRAEIVDIILGAGRAGFVAPCDAVPFVADRLVALVHRLCAVAPTALVVDDAQWVDNASLSVLGRLAGLLGQLPLLLVVAGRHESQRVGVPGLRARLGGGDLVTVDLGPLGRDEATELVHLMVGAAPGPALIEHAAAAGGNPLYLRELVDALVREARLQVKDGQAELISDAADLPPTLQAAIAARLGFLSPRAVSVLRMAAVLGPSFTVADVAMVTGRDEADLAGIVKEVTNAGILVGSESTASLAFRHGLVHQTLYQTVPASLRAALHREAAEKLAGAGAPAEQVASQLLAAPPAIDDWAVDWLLDAAPALTPRAPQAASELLSRARNVLGAQDGRRESVEVELAMALLTLGNNDAAEKLTRSALARSEDPANTGRLAWILTIALTEMGRQEEAIEVTHQAMSRKDLPPAWRARLRARLAMALFSRYHYPEARIEAERAEAEGHQAGDRLAIAYALYSLAHLDVFDRTNTAAGKEAVERALAALVDEPQASELLLMLMGSLGAALGAIGRPAEADAMFGRAAVLAEKRGSPARQAQLAIYSATWGFYRGRWNESLAELEPLGRFGPWTGADGPVQLRPGQTYRPYLAGIGGLIAAHRNDRELAETLLIQSESALRGVGDVLNHVEFVSVARACLAERDAAPHEALRRLLDIFDPEATREFTGLGVMSLVWLPDVVRLAITVDDVGVAAAAARVAARLADQDVRPTSAAVARHCQGLVDSDVAAVQDAAERLAAVGYPLFTGQAFENAAVLLAEAGDANAARTALVDAVEIYQQLDAEWDIVRADRRLRVHNIRRSTQRARRRPATGWEALTSTEQKVARMVAKGQSNPDIASELFLSRHTVESHVSHILTKLNARSRFEIAREATQRTVATENS